MNRFRFWSSWLVSVAIIMIVFGVIMALMNQTPFFQTIINPIEKVFWSQGGPEPGFPAYQAWFYGVWGAAIAGMGVFAGFVAYYAFKSREKWAYRCFACGTLLWFVLDTGISITARVYFNAVFNVLILAAIGLPLAFTWKEFNAE